MKLVLEIILILFAYFLLNEIEQSFLEEKKKDLMVDSLLSSLIKLSQLNGNPDKDLIIYKT